MDQRIINIYKDVLVKGLVPSQYFYQVLQGRMTGRSEVVMKKSNGNNFLFHYDDPDELVYDLDQNIVDAGRATITLVRVVPTRKKLFKTTMEWCIKYLWFRIKNFISS